VIRSPKPWGVTALFGEHTGAHAPIEIEWSLDRPLVQVARTPAADEWIAPAATADVAVVAHDPVTPAIPAGSPVPPVEDPVPVSAPFASLGEFAVAVNRSEPAALAIAANGATAAIPVEGLEVRKLLGTIWFRTVVPKLSEAWRARILDALVTTAIVPNHVVRIGRQPMRLGELTYAQLHELATKSSVIDGVRPDLDLLVTVGRLWGSEAVTRFRFGDVPVEREPSRLAGLLGSWH
jgi:hypothetical protein